MNNDTLEQATRWLLRRTNGERLTTAEQGEFESWLANPAHRREYEHLEAMHAGLRDARLVSDQLVRQTLAETAPPRSRHRWLPAKEAEWRRWFGHPAALATVALTAVVVLVWIGLNRPGPTTPYATGFGERPTVRLSDGSRVEMDSETRFSATYSSKRRHLEAFYGRAVFTVERDPARPFIIEAGQARVRVVGTQFQVDRQNDSLDVTVLEGTVEVSPGVGSAGAGLRSATVLRAGQRVVVSAEGTFSPVEPAPVAEFALWRTGKIDFRERPLAEVVREADRYFDGTIIIREESLRSLRLSGSFAVADPISFLFALPDILPVRVERVDQRTIVISVRE